MRSILLATMLFAGSATLVLVAAAGTAQAAAPVASFTNWLTTSSYAYYDPGVDVDRLWFNPAQSGTATATIAASHANGIASASWPAPPSGWSPSASTDSSGTAATGITGTYYDSAPTTINYGSGYLVPQGAFTGTSHARTDSDISFNWGTGTPYADLGADTFSVRWSGTILIPSTGTYYFQVAAQDGYRLTVNGASNRLSFWENLTGTRVDTNCGGGFSFTAGDQIPITLEYFENDVSSTGANVELRWKRPTDAFSIPDSTCQGGNSGEKYSGFFTSGSQPTYTKITSTDFIGGRTEFSRTFSWSSGAGSGTPTATLLSNTTSETSNAVPIQFAADSTGPTASGTFTLFSGNTWNASWPNPSGQMPTGTTDAESGVNTTSSRFLQRQVGVGNNGSCDVTSASWVTIQTDPAWNTTWTDTSSVADGSCAYYRLLMVDRVGNQTIQNGTGYIGRDSSPPTAVASFVEGTNPQYQYVDPTVTTYPKIWVNLNQNASIYGSFTFHVVASDAGYGVKKLGGAIQPSYPWTYTSTDINGAGPFDVTYTFNYDQYNARSAPGYTTSAYVTDNTNGNRSVPMDISADNTNPSASLDQPNGLVSSVTVNLTATDAQSGIDGTLTKLQRRSTTRVSGSTCDTANWSAWGDLATYATIVGTYPSLSYPDLTVAVNNCYQYRWYVRDNVYNTPAGSPYADGDTAVVSVVGYTLTPTSRTVTEGGATQTFTVAMNVAPSQTTVVDLTSVTGQAAITAPASHQLTFTTANWATPQTVTIAAVDDAVDETSVPPDDQIAVHAGSGDAGFVAMANVYEDVTVVDNDAAGFVVSPSSVAVTEAAGGSHTATYTVKLASQPTANVTVTLGNTDGQVSYAPASLLFTSANWNTNQTVTVTGTDDLVTEANPHTGTITQAVTSADTFYNGYALANMTASVTDDDIPGIALSPTSGLTLNEGAPGTTASYTVRLQTQPSATITVTLGVDAQSTVSSGTLTFTTANWNTPQPVTVTVVNDGFVEGNHTSAITHSAAGDATYSAVATVTQTIAITDNDVRGLEVTAPAASSITEAAGGSHATTYQVRLTAAPTANVTVSPANASGDVAAMAPLTFTTANWSTYQTVTLTAVDDAIDEASPETVTITHALSSGDTDYNAMSVSSQSIDVVDDDVAAITVDPGNGVAVAEATPAVGDTYSVVLATQPTAAVTVTVTPNAQVATDASTLLFTTANWATPQVVTVTAVNDAVDEADPHAGSVAMTVASADGAYGALSIAAVPVSVADDDTAGITVSAGAITVAEAGATSGTYTIVLNSQPTAAVTVALTADAQVTRSPASLTFTTANWATPQTVTVAAVDDAIVEAATHSGVVSHAVTSGDAAYNGMTVAAKSATITDNDVAGITVTQSGGSTAVTEGGATDSYTIALTAQPSANVTVTLGPDAQVTADAATLTFTAANWNTPQTVVVTAVNDSATEGTHSGVITHAVTTTDPQWAAYTAGPTVTATITDDDIPGVTITAPSMSVLEQGPTSGTYTIVLNTQPSANVTVALTADAQVTLSATSFTFTPANWNTAQTVTVTAVNDARHQGTHVSTITHAVTGAPLYAGVSVANEVVTITDNDTASVQITPGSGLTATEGGAGSSYTVQLSSEPSANVTVAFNGGSQIQAIGSITFTPATWNTPQTATVAAIDDQIAEGAHAGTITHTVTSSDPDYSGFATPSQSVAITDNDTAGFTVVGAGSIAVAEAGATSDTITVALTSQPTGTVTVTPAVGDAQTSVSGALTFTGANWSTPQTVTITAVDDGFIEASPHTGTISFVIAGADATYAALTMPNASAAITDNDVAGITVTPVGAQAVAEAGPTSASYTVVLTASPTASVSIALTPDSQVTATTGPLVFTAANWSTPQTVTMTAVDDPVLEGAHSGSLAQAVSSADPNFAVLTLANHTVTITDNESATVTVNTAGGVAVAEGGATDTYTVVLDAQPLQNVSVAINPDSQVTVSVPSLTFTSANWNAPQTVTVTAVDDPDSEISPHTGAISHAVTSADANWSATTAASVSASVTDNDIVGITVTPTAGLSIAEAGTTTATYTMVLATRPTADVVVAVSGDADATASPTSLTFTSATWNTPQTVTVTAVDDAIAEGTHSATISHAVTSADPLYAGQTAATVTASVTDDDVAGIVATPTAGLTAAEGGAGSSYQIHLTSQPTANVSIAFATGTQIQAIGSLTFTPANWATDQTVAVAAVDDAVAEGTHTGTVSHTVTSADPGYAGRALAAESIAITDNDTAGITLAGESSLAVAEAGATSDTFTLQLTSQPVASVTVTVSFDAQVAATPAVVTFTTADWNTPHTVTVTAVDDPVVEAATHPGVVSFTLGGGDPAYAAMTLADVTATVTDDDVAGVSFSTAGPLAVTEGGATATYTVRLTSQPSSNVDLSTTGDTQVSTGSSALTFTPATWNTPQTVTVTAVDDPTVETPVHTGSVAHAVTSGDPAYAALTPAAMPVNVTDNDSATIVVDTANGVDVTEGGGTDTMTLRLGARPTADVVVTLTPDAQTTLSTTTLTFTSTNWNTPQTVTITAVDDGAIEANPHGSTIAGSGTSSDPLWSLTPMANVAATVHDNDVAGVTITQSGAYALDEDTPAPATSVTYTAVLDAQPTADVTLALTLPSDLSAVATSLTFTSTNWNVPQTITFGAVDDAIVEGSPHTRTITHATTSSDVHYAGLTVASVSASITDNDAAGVLLSTPLVAVAEGGATDTYDVTLTSQPASTVTITLTGSQVTTNPTVLTIAPGAWNTPQTVTVTAIDDDVFETNPHAGLITASVASADPTYAGIPVGDVTADIADDDNPGITVTPGSTPIAIAEAGPSSATYTVMLESEPTAPVTVATATPDGQTTASPASLTFTAANWHTAQTVTVTAVDDPDVEASPHAATVTHTVTTADPTYSGWTVGDQAVAVTDNDVVGVVTTPSAGLTLSEAAPATTATFTVRLATRPTGTVTIATSTPDGQTSASPATLTFTAATWNVAQTVTVTVVDDFAFEGAHTATVVLDAASAGDAAYDAFDPADATIAVTDNDIPGVTIVQSAGSTDVDEASATDTYTVVLDSRPSTDVTIAVTGGAQASAAPTSLTFTSANWSTPQTVTVSGTPDSLVEGAHTQSIAHAATSGDSNYDGIAIATVTAHVTDDDVAGVDVAPTALTLAEGGATDSYDVVLTGQPASDVTIDVTSDGQQTTSVAHLTFTSATWDTPQTVTVTAVDDDIDEASPHAGLITHATHSSDPHFDGLPVSNVTTAIDDDDQSGVTVTPTAVAVTEGGATATYTVVLDSQPTADVTVSATDPSGQAQAIVPLTFTAANWSTPQTVTVRATDDFVTEGTHAATIEHDTGSVDPTYASGTVSVADVLVTITDNDVAGVVMTPSAGVAGTEGGAQPTYQLSLATQPTAPVTIALAGDAQASPTPASITFTSATWNIPVTVTAGIVDDAVVEGPHTAVLTHVLSSADPFYAALTVPNQQVAITDDDTAGVAFTPVAPGPLTVAEHGATATYTVRLTSQPGASVTLALAATGGDVAIDQPTLTFTAGTWNAPQTVTVTAVDDAFVEGTHSDVIVHTSTSGDPNYGGLVVPDMHATITDDDVAGLVITPSGATTDITEGGATDTVDVSLGARPTADVVVTLTVDAQIRLDTQTLTFTTANWNTPQQVVITAVDDDLAEGAHTGVLTATAASADGPFDQLTAQHTAAITDDDAAGVVITPPSSARLLEETPTVGQTYQVHLASEPTAPVDVQIAPDAQVATSLASLHFTPANWSVDQPVTVTAILDRINEGGDHQGVVAHGSTSSDAAYAAGVLTIDTLTFDITDFNEPALLITPLSGHAVSEDGATSSYSIELNTIPAAPVTVSPSSNQLDWTVASITFSSATWNVPQVVTLRAVDDHVDEVDPHVGTLAHVVTSTDADYDGLAADDVTASIADNDTAAVAITPGATPIAVAEAGTTSATYDVVLTAQPTAPVTIALDVPDAQVSTDVATLTVAPNAWDTPQTVTVTAVDDRIDEADPHPSALHHVVTSADTTWNGLAAPDQAVAVADDDTAAVLVIASGSDTTVAEDGTRVDDYTVVLASQPTADVTVTITHADGQAAPSPATLLFTAATWDQPQTVTVAAIDDDVVEAPTHPGMLEHDVVSADPRYDGVAAAALDVTVVDDDVAGITITPAGGTLEVAEGGTTDAFLVQLGSQPTAPVTVAFATPDGQTSVTPASVVLDATNWNTGVTVAVTATDDGAIEGTHTGTITATAVTSTDAVYAALALPTDQSVQITDDDSADIVVDAADGLDVAESTPTVGDTVAIVLQGRPASAATVDVALQPDTQVTLDRTNLSFDVANWNVPQVVTVTAVDDDLDEAATHPGTISFVVTSADPAFDAYALADLQATVRDDDTSGIVTSPATGLSVAEAGATSDVVAIHLTAEPTADVKIDLSDDGQVTAAPSSLTFTSADWDQDQIVTVTAVDDSVDEASPHTGTLTLDVSSTDALYDAVADGTVVASIADDDTAAILVDAPTAAQVAEADATTGVDVAYTLGTEPSGTVVLTLVPDAQLTTSVSSLSFTAADWDQPHVVTAYPVDDSVDESDLHPGLLAATVDTASTDVIYRTLTVASQTVQVQDDDEAGIVLVQDPVPGLLDEVHALGNATYTVALTSQPVSPVTVVATPDAQVSMVGATSQRFTAADWDQPKTFTVRAVDDEDTEADGHPGLVTHTATSNDPAYGSGSAVAAALVDAQFAIDDDDDPGFTFAPSVPAPQVAEQRATRATYRLSIDSAPARPVTVAFDNPDDNLTVSPSSYTFTAANATIPVTITVIAIDDALVEGVHVAAVTHTITTLDPLYGDPAVTIPDVAVTIADNDTATLVVDAGDGVAVTEGGAGDTVTVRLDARPPSDVVVTATSSTQLAAMDPMTFTSLTWNVPQTLRVAATDDHVAEGAHLASITLTTDSSDPSFDAVSAPAVPVSITDDDTASVAATVDRTTLREADVDGTERTVTVRLGSEPLGIVSITAVSDGQLDIVGTPVLQFDATNWDTGLTLAIRAVDDRLVEEPVHPGTLTFRVDGPDDAAYDHRHVDPLTFDITDDEVPGIRCEPGQNWAATAGEHAHVAEGSDPATRDAICVLTPSGAPTRDVRVSISTDPSGQLRAPAFVTLQAGSTDPVAITIAAVDDRIDEGDHAARVMFDVVTEDPRFATLTVNPVLVDIADDDTAGFTVTPGDLLAIAEGGSALPVTVVLTSQPAAAVLLSADAGSQATATVEGGPLTFDATNWDTPRTIMVEAIDDGLDEPDPHPGELTFTRSSADQAYVDAPLAALALEIADNDVPEVLVTRTKGATAVSESGDLDTISIRLGAMPTFPVIVAIDGDDQVTNTPASVEFSSLDWDIPKLVTVAAVQDVLVEGRHTGQLTLTTTSTDTAYAALPVLTESVSVTDDDVAGVTATETDASTTLAEGGRPDTYTVVLTGKPTASVTIDIDGDGQVSLDPAQLTFAPESWNEPQTVTATAIQDSIDEASPHVGAITHRLTTTASGWASATMPAIDAKITDDDDAQVLVTQSGDTTQLTEGDDTPEEVYVRLVTQPTADVSVVPNADTQLDLLTSKLTFTPDNWKDVQTIKLLAVDDEVVEGAHAGTLGFTLETRDAVYAKQRIDAVTASIADNDTTVASTPPDDITGTDPREKLDPAVPPTTTTTQDDSGAATDTASPTKRSGTSALDAARRNLPGTGSTATAPKHRDSLRRGTVIGSTTAAKGDTKRANTPPTAIDKTMDWLKAHWKVWAPALGLLGAILAAALFLTRGDPISTARRRGAAHNGWDDDDEWSDDEDEWSAE